MDWINVQEKLPELPEATENCKPLNTIVLVFNGRTVFDCMYSPKHGFYSGAWEQVEGVTHWMELPEPPIEVPKIYDMPFKSREP
jgi:hypothetical protein